MVNPEWDRLDQRDSERIIESLRSGVPFASLAQHLPSGRGPLLARVREALTETDPRPLVVRSNYGEGKTHFLQTVAGMALASNFVVSTVSISREAPLFRLDQLYARLVEGTRVPGTDLPGIQPILERLRGDPATVQAHLTEMGVPGRLIAAVGAYLQDDLAFRDELLADLGGQWLMVSRFKTILRQLWGKVRIEKFSPMKEPMAVYRLLSHLIRLAGFSGWIILLDEVELVGKTGLGMRARAYANLSLLTQSDSGLDHTWVVAAVASNYFTDVIEEKQDRVRAVDWLKDRKQEENAARAQDAIALLFQADLLPPLSHSEIEALLTFIRAAHARAYGWEPPPDQDLYQAVYRHVPAIDAKLRAKIRTAVWWLDLWHQYGKEPTVTVWHVGETDLTEDPQTVEPDPSLGVQRDRIF